MPRSRIKITVTPADSPEKLIFPHYQEWGRPSVSVLSHAHNAHSAVVASMSEGTSRE